MKMKKIKIAINRELYGDRFLVFKVTKRGRSFLKYTSKSKLEDILSPAQFEDLTKNVNRLFEVKRETLKRVFPETVIK